MKSVVRMSQKKSVHEILSSIDPPHDSLSVYVTLSPVHCARAFVGSGYVILSNIL